MKSNRCASAAFLAKNMSCRKWCSEFLDESLSYNEQAVARRTFYPKK
ncbi:hypothetical protein BRO54_3884 [Geobacillus proteiniphilus]|uniref:Uncharacterized protein n=1 Tax=Geobacillus proteiniphilus TaxID=860353 RepID=A0A1Q5SDP7_9BACL|nr:hypothetical protein BRO54_3884 [Geobacillus proteiniphilus]